MSDSDENAIVDSTSRKQIRRTRRTAGFLRRREISDIRSTLATAQGRRFLWRLLIKCGVYHQVDIESTNRVLVNEGKRSIGLFLINELEAAQPNALEQLRAESQTDVTP